MITPPLSELPVLYQDDYLVAVNKPSGLLMHRSGIDRHETQFAMQLVRDQLQRRIYPLHRLDKPTSGVLVFAFDIETTRQLGMAFAQQQVSKTYLALVRGFTEPEGIIDYAYVERADPYAKSRRSEPLAAVTAYRRLATVELPVAVGRYASSRYSLLEVQPKSGRRHQIRKHMKHIFHPIIGDTTYGEGRHNRFFRQHFQCSRLLLAATRLMFIHPHNKQQLTISAPLEESFAQMLLRLGLGDVY